MQLLSLPDRYSTVMLIIDRIATGRTLTRSCQEYGVSVANFNRWMRDAPEEIKELYVEAQQVSYDTMAEALVNIQTDAVYGTEDARMANVISGNIKWLLSKRRQREYGEKLTVEHNITADKAITEALDRAKERFKSGVTLDLVAKDVTEEAVKQIVHEAEPVIVDDWMRDLV